MNRMLCLLFLATTCAAEGNNVSLEERFQKLGKDASWRLTEEYAIAFCTYHPQGMTAVGDRFFLSSVEVTGRNKEQGRGHLFEMTRTGSLLRTITLGEGALYHPGGIDFDGAVLWVSVGAYRPNSASIVYQVDPDSMEVREAFRYPDHLGAIVHCPENNTLIAVNWGARRFYRWETAFEDGISTVKEPDHPEISANGNCYIDYQDMQRIPHTPYLLCSGLQGYSVPGGKLPAMRLGGIDLVHIGELRAYHQIPVPLRMPALPAWTQNPFYVETSATGLRFYFVPEDESSKLYVFEVDAG